MNTNYSLWGSLGRDDLGIPRDDMGIECGKNSIAFTFTDRSAALAPVSRYPRKSVSIVFQ